MKISRRKPFFLITLKYLLLKWGILSVTSRLFISVWPHPHKLRCGSGGPRPVGNGSDSVPAQWVQGVPAHYLCSEPPALHSLSFVLVIWFPRFWLRCFLQQSSPTTVCRKLCLPLLLSVNNSCSFLLVFLKEKSAFNILFLCSLAHSHLGSATQTPKNLIWIRFF